MTRIHTEHRAFYKQNTKIVPGFYNHHTESHHNTDACHYCPLLAHLPVLFLYLFFISLIDSYITRLRYRIVVISLFLEIHLSIPYPRAPPSRFMI